MITGKIIVLPDHLSNQIAAGEVVERPASVVKELVENALDAGSTRIVIEIELGGRRLMQVADDGEGMIREDALLAFERHATSKIKTEEDLGRIRTLGFRGEALASIASVAKVEMITKVHDGPSGTRVLIEGGTLSDVREAARPTGTTVAVRDLFFNTPARRKFMRSQATENFHITSIVTHYALANPAVAFSLKSNGRELIRTVPAKNLKERAFQIFGPRLIESLLPVEGGREFVANVSGFVSAPRERRTTRDAQYFFINGRFVKDRLISAGLQEGYRSVLPHGVYPVALLFLDIPLEEIDVNVHPAKTEVRFRRALAVRDVIAEAVKAALADAGIGAAARSAGASESPASFDVSGRVATAEAEYEPPESEPDAPQERIDFRIPADAGDFERIAEERAAVSPEVPSSQSFEDLSGAEPAAGVPVFDSAESLPKPLEVEDLDPGAIRPMGQLHDSFIIAQDDQGLLLIDQHVAHERILFDKFRIREDQRPVESQHLLVPETIDLTPAQAEIFPEVKEDLENAGFGVRELSGRTVAVQSVPNGLPQMDIANLLAELLDSADKSKRKGTRAAFRDEIAASLACKAAVKINMKLTEEKMAWMVDRLFTTSSPTTCPHGRPVILRLTMKDIERRFHRT
ncbi:MAG: DNA mismatch repair endonuclease MutL [Acidobacteriota bacterium]|nr:MAG: DNA mismatch repair endonuclease MutL [Acidobacteriota bacterium]